MRALLIPVGSAGDVHPHVGLALSLRARGHDVTVATSPYFRPLIERVGLRLVPLGTVENTTRLPPTPICGITAKGSTLSLGRRASRRASSTAWYVSMARGTTRSL